MTELYHFGIKGQRWGVRRFQSPDGTLTAAGKARYKAYKKDFKSYDKLNRHVSASQKHLKEEGVMLDRVRDKYLKTNKAYRKEMSKSSGLFGLKAVDKAERVAKSQVEMERVTKDYESAAGSYGVAKKIVKEDQKALRDHVTKMIRSYGKGSINDLKTENVKMGQNKLQKLLQGAPMSIILNKGRDTEEFIKTGKTLADLPIVGNLYTANYIGNRELDITRGRIERSTNKAKRDSGKDGKDPKYIDPENDYFDGVTSTSKARKKFKAEKDAEEAKKKSEARKEAAESKKKAEDALAEAKANAKLAEEEFDKVKYRAISSKSGEILDKNLKDYIDKNLNNVSVSYYDKKENKQKRVNLTQTPEYKQMKAQQDALEKATKELKKATKRAKEMNSSSSKKRSGGIASSVVGSAAAAAAAAAAGPIAGYAAKQGVKAYAKRKAKKKWQKWFGHSATYRVVRSDELYHHGVKGQRWGIRRYQNPDGTLTAKGKKRKEKLYAKAEKEYEKGINSKYLNKIDPHNSEFQKKLLALKKKEIDEGFNYMENRLKRNLLVGALLGGIPGVWATTMYSAIRYHKQDAARQKLMSNERQLEAARQDAFDRMNRWQREIDTQNMYRQMEFNNWQTSNMYTYRF